MDTITALSARYNVLRGALEVVLAKLARASGDPERFVMDMEKVMDTTARALAAQRGRRGRGRVQGRGESDV